MVILRLARFGAKKRPFYRIVAADSRGKRDGRFIELLGTYNPLTDPILLNLDIERVEYWQSVGAQTSSTVKRLIEIKREQAEGIAQSPKVLKKKARLARKEAAKAAAVEEAPVEAAPEKPAVEEKPAEEAPAEAAPEKPAVEEKPAEEAPVEAAPEKPAVEEKPAEEKKAETEPE